MVRISFVIPCFNNEENIDDLFSALLENQKQFQRVYFEYVMINDASSDKTSEVLKKWQKNNLEQIKVIELNKNIGSHKAIFKGLNSVTGDCVIVMAADLQDPPELSYQMFQEWENGNTLVLAVKNNPLPLFSKLFHNLMRSLSVNKAPKGAFDYVLFDRSFLPNLQKPSIKNCNLFYRLVDLEPKFSILYYTKKQRQKGKSGWSFSKKIIFFTENITAYLFSKSGIIR